MIHRNTKKHWKFILCLSYFIIYFMIPNIGIPIKYDFIFDWISWFPLILSFMFLVLFHQLLYQSLVEIQWLKLIFIAVFCIVSIIVINTALPDTNSLPLNSLANSELKKYIISATTYGVFLEEMIFRFSLISLHSDRKTKASLLIISSFLFSIVHGRNFNLFFCGVLFGFVYIKTSNVWYAILTHVFYNGVGIFLFLFFT